MKKYIVCFLLVAGILFTYSCTKDFEELNQEWALPVETGIGPLFNGLVKSLMLGGNEQFYVNNEVLYKQTQQAALTKDAWGNLSIGTEDIWSNYYRALAHARQIDLMISEMETDPDVDLDELTKNNILAMVKTLMAYKTFKVTDLFGDMPYFDAGYGFESLEYLRPKFDTQEEIYKGLLNELKWVDDNIVDSANTSLIFLGFATYDNLLYGDLVMWRKMANSLRLRHAMRMAEKDLEFAGPIIQDIIENERPVINGYDFIVQKLESVALWPYLNNFSNNVNWTFREHNNLRMGSNIWHQLAEHDSIDGSGIFDPRGFMFFEPDYDNEWKAFPQQPEVNTQTSGGTPYASHRDSPGNFGLKGEDCIYSPFNYFITRDEDIIPIIMITGAEVHFIKAEAYFRGIGVSLDQNKADEEYMNGITSSLEWWGQEVMDKSYLPTTGYLFTEMNPIPEGLNISTVLNHFGSWMAADDEEKLEFIYTQRWLDAFRQPWEAYALARRTGKTPREGDPIGHYRLPYPPSEAEYNSENYLTALSRQGGETSDVKLWWIP